MPYEMRFSILMTNKHGNAGKAAALGFEYQHRAAVALALYSIKDLREFGSEKGGARYRN